MTNIIAWVIFAGVVGSALVQAGFVVAYVSKLISPRPQYPRNQWPKAAIVLSVRGPDPFLEENMAAVLDQNYDDYTLFIVVDSESDAAWPYVRRVQQMAPDRVVTMVLQDRRKTCSLKCSALAEAVERLDPSYEVVAFLDGDAPPYRNWLRDLVAPLSEPSVGVTTGNRWYTPQRQSWGTLVRYFWNAGAVVQVWANGLTWAGSMAMRREVIEEIELVAAWRKALSVDATVVRQIRAKRLRVKFVPYVIMANPEDISLSSFIPWTERQMVAAKSSGAVWPIILMHATAIATCMLAPCAMLALGMIHGDMVSSGLAIGAMCAYWGGAALSSLAIERAMQRVFVINRVASPWMNWRTALRFLPAMLLSHFVYFRTLWGVFRRNRVTWRGVEYEIRGVNDVRMLRYNAYEASCDHSLAESVI